MRFLIFLFLLAGIAYSQVPPIEPGVSQELAKWRAAHYSDVRYKLNLTLEKMSPVLKGTIEIRVQVAAQAETRPVGSVPSDIPIILDWRKIRGHEDKSKVSNVSINGQSATLENHPVGETSTPRSSRKEGSLVYREINEHLIFQDGVVAGENVIKLDFTSPILTSGSAITRYVDKEDGSEYIYSLFVPSDASTAFPVFDQPDLKAKFSLNLTFPKEWEAVSNSHITNVRGSVKDEDPDPVTGAFRKVTYERIFSFAETKPISTYVFAFAAGPWEKVTDTGGNPSGSEGVNASPGRDTLPIGRVSAWYVRRSQAAKFQPHAAEVFRLNREAVKYFEEYFDYKFPFPKYDLVLIPEFPFGGMEHAGATFLRESSIIFPQEPTKNDYISRATVIFHETAHQWFGDTVTMRWFDDLWLKEGFATFMGYKALEKIMPEMNAWKVFYERIKQGAYQTDSTKGTTPIYQEIKNLSAAKSAYGNIVYNKAPAFLRQAEFYLGEDKFQTAVRAFLKKHEFANAGWEDLVREFEDASKLHLTDWANVWVKRRGLPVVQAGWHQYTRIQDVNDPRCPECFAGLIDLGQAPLVDRDQPTIWKMQIRNLSVFGDNTETKDIRLDSQSGLRVATKHVYSPPINAPVADFVFPNYQDYGYGIFLLDEKSRDYVLKNIQNEKDPFLRTMMWGALWDSVREGELDPREYVELAIKNLRGESDESMVASILGRTGTAMNYYLPEERVSSPHVSKGSGNDSIAQTSREPSLTVGLRTRVENLLIDRMQ